MEVLRLHVVAEFAHLLYSDGLGVGEVDPDGADGWGGGVGDGVFFYHGLGGIGLEFEGCSAGEKKWY